MKVITFEKYTLTADNYGRFDVTKRVSKTRKKKDDPQVKESDEVKTLVEYLKFMLQTIKSINLDV